MSYEYVSFGQVSEKTDAFAAGIVLIGTQLKNTPLLLMVSLLELLCGINGKAARELLENSPTDALTEHLCAQAVFMRPGAQGNNGGLRWPPAVLTLLTKFRLPT